MKSSRERFGYLLLGVALVVLVLVMLPTFVKNPHRSRGLECHDNIRRVGGYLMECTEKHWQRLPAVESGKKQSTSEWAHAVSECLSGSDRRRFLKSLKCPLDTSGAYTSYELNAALAGQSLEYVREHSEIWLLRERDHTDTHRYFYFPDGRTEMARSPSAVK